MTFDEVADKFYNDLSTHKQIFGWCTRHLSLIEDDKDISIFQGSDFNVLISNNAQGLQYLDRTFTWDRNSFKICMAIKEGDVANRWLFTEKYFPISSVSCKGYLGLTIEQFKQAIESAIKNEKMPNQLKHSSHGLYWWNELCEFVQRTNISKKIDLTDLDNWGIPNRTQQDFKYQFPILIKFVK